jgi:hypothetical protein
LFSLIGYFCLVFWIVLLVKISLKDAYLDLSKPYTYNWNNTQSYTKKDNQANKLLKQVGTTIGSTVHSAIGSTNSDNPS